MERSVLRGGWDKQDYIEEKFSVENFNQISPIGFGYRGLNQRPAGAGKPKPLRAPLLRQHAP
jgi:hypothetical protein